MLFNSQVFFAFLLLVLALYFRLERRRQNLLLLVASYVFYGWWDWRFCGLLLFSTALDYGCGRAMEKRPAAKRAFLLLSLAGNLGILGFFKYWNFFADSAAKLLAELGMRADPFTLQIILPVGISFYTFQTLAYTIDVYRGELPATRNLLTFALYVSYFPQLVAGPIERAQHMFGQFERDRRVTPAAVRSAVLLMLVGFFKKLVLADGVASTVESIFARPDHHDWITLLLGAILFSIQIYGDFSGYTDIARGVSRLFGIELMVNFRRPYLSRSITEFWRRWHISLSSWLRDYLYIPLGGNRGGRWKTYRNLLLTMLLGGLWHGAAWTFVAWGALHGLYLAIHKALLRGRRESTDSGGGFRRWATTPLVFLLVTLTWIFFRAPSMDVALRYFGGILSFRGGFTDLPLFLGAITVFFGGLMVLLDLHQERHEDDLSLARLPWAVRGAIYAGMILAIVLLTPSHETPFIYFQF